jgi:hypothetical protein
MLRDALSQMPLDTGMVEVRWQEILLGAGRIASVERNVRSPLGKEGWFALCGVPGSTEVIGRAWRGNDTTGLVAITTPIAGLTRHDFFLGGVSNVRGSVESEQHLPIASARVALAGLDRAAIADSAGQFYLGAIPAGSQTIEVRAIGFAPDLRALTLVPTHDTTLAFQLTSIKRVLDTIHVVARGIYNRDSNGFLRRKRMGLGRFFDEEWVQRWHPFDMYSLLMHVPTVQLSQRGFTRSVLMRGDFASCSPTVFLDGVRMPSDIVGDLDLLVRPDELAGMEVYRGAFTPAEFHTFDGCGAIVLWTKPRSRVKA